jgi:hypothetical protein
MNEGPKTGIAELIARENELIFADVRAAREGGDSGAIHQALADVRAELKAARRIATMRTRRTEPIKDVGIRINVSADEYHRLSNNAAAAAMTLSNYIRHLLKSKG